MLRLIKIHEPLNVVTSHMGLVSLMVACSR